MVKKAHTITISALQRDDEDRFNAQQLQDAICAFIPQEIEEEQFEKEGIALAQEELPIDDGVDVTKFTLEFSKDRIINPLLGTIKELLGEEQSKAIATQENRIDEKGNFYIRINKEEWVLNENTVLTDSGDCIHIKFVLAAFPKNKTIATKLVKEIFG